ncbi:MAG: FAD-binding protein [Chloroflexi bacterium]|nr:FAD-binding protein [Chloroflexota bacterium]
MPVQWKEETEVIVVGYGGAGAIAAINAHDSGARTLILEKQAQDTPTRCNHTPSTRMAGGGWFSPKNVGPTIEYIEGMARVTNETIDPARKVLIANFAKYLTTNTEYMKSIGVEMGSGESVLYSSRRAALTDAERALIASGDMPYGDYPNLPGAEEGFGAFPKLTGQFRNGAALFRFLYKAIDDRKIPVMWETPAEHLVMERGQVRGVIARQNGKPIAIRARRGVILCCGGFEFNDFMKENYLRVAPVHFYGNPACTGDGINMCLEIGVNLWHMNCASWRAVMKFPDHPIAIGTRNHEDAIFVDKFGKRFTSERYRAHAFGYELTNYDARQLTYPKAPFWMVFDERRRRDGGRLASYHGACNPPGGIHGDIHYDWSDDNQKEVDRGWIVKAGTVEELAERIKADPDSGGFFTPTALRETVRRYNELCRKGEDTDFDKPKKWLLPIENPPYYAIKLFPGGPNTQGGPRRNERGQVLRVDGSPIPRLYSAGEIGSVWGMIYQGGGNIAECIAFGRITGANAAAEKPAK